MSYRLLGEPVHHINGVYQGTYRYGPTYVDALPPTDPLNQLFLKYAHNEGFFTNAEDAIQLAALYDLIGMQFDVVYVVEGEHQPKQVQNNLLGFDVSTGGWWSMLSWGLQWEQVNLPVGPLLHLMELYFRPKLNNVGLFSVWEDAQLFLDVVKAVSALAPGTFESEESIVDLQISELITIKMSLDQGG